MLAPRCANNTSILRWVGLLGLNELYRSIVRHMGRHLNHLLLLLRLPPLLRFGRLPLLVDGMMVSACRSVLTSSVPQEVETVGLLWSLRQELKHHGRRPLVRPNLIEENVLRQRSALVRTRNEDSIRANKTCRSHGGLGRVMKFACLTKLAAAMLHVVLANGLVRTNGEQRLRRIDWSPHATTTLYIGRVAEFTRCTILASSSSQIVAAILGVGNLLCEVRSHFLYAE